MYNSYYAFLFPSSAPTRAPDIITVHISSSTSLIVTWNHLPVQYFNGEPLGYKVTYQPVNFERKVNFVTVNYKNATELTNLSAFTMYVINVSALSSGGVGPWNTTKARTGDEGTDGFGRVKILITESHFGNVLLFKSGLDLADFVFNANA